MYSIHEYTTQQAKAKPLEAMCSKDMNQACESLRFCRQILLGVRFGSTHALNVSAVSLPWMNNTNAVVPLSEHLCGGICLDNEFCTVTVITLVECIPACYKDL